MVPEVEEEEEEDDAIQSNEVDENGVCVRTFFHEIVLANMNGHDDKLDLRKEKTSKNTMRVKSDSNQLGC